MERDIVAELRALAESQELRRQAEESCRESMRNCAAEPDGLSGWHESEIELHFRRCALVFDHWVHGPFVETAFGLYARHELGHHRYPDGLLDIGSYRLITTLDGSIQDDYFVLDTTRAEADDQLRR